MNVAYGTRHPFWKTTLDKWKRCFQAGDWLETSSSDELEDEILSDFHQERHASMIETVSEVSEPTSNTTQPILSPKEDTSTPQPVESESETTQDSRPEIPTSLLALIASYLDDRATFNSLSISCKEVLQICKKLIPPWPITRLRVGSSSWSLAFSPDGTMLACGAGNGKICAWHQRTGPLKPFTGHLGRVYSLAFSPDGTTLASGSGDGDLRLWQLEDRSCTQFSLRSPHIDSLAFNPEGSILATGGDSSIRLWDMKRKTCIAVLPEQHQVVEALAFSPDGNMLASGSWSNCVRLWDVSARTCIAVLQEPAEVHSVAFSPDGSKLASAGDSGVVRVRSLDDLSYFDLDGHTEGCWSVVFSKDGTSIASGNDDGTVRLWNSTTGTCKELWMSHSTESVHAIALLDGLIASAGNDGFVAIHPCTPSS